MTPSPTIAVIGAGAVGAYYGGRLAAYGLPVHFLARSSYDSLLQTGLRVHSCKGDFQIPPAQLRLHRTASDIPPVDLILIALKTTASDQFQSLIPPLLKPSTIIITLQNGLGNEDLLAGLFGPDRVFGGIAFTCIQRLPDGLILHTAHGLIHLGSFSSSPTNSEQLEILSSLFQSAGIECHPVPDLLRGRWSKLIWNIPFNGLGAALNLATDQLLASNAGVELVSSLMHETMSAASADGIAFDHPDRIVSQQLAKTREMASYRTSMQIDRQLGRPMEIQAIVGNPLRRGLSAGLSMPHTQNLYKLLCAVDAKSP